MLKSNMNPRVFWGASLIIGLLLGLAIAAPGLSDRIFQTAQGWVIDTFGWFYIAAVAGFLGLVVFLALENLLPNAAQVETHTAPGGHLGVLTGRSAMTTTWDYLDDFLRRHDTFKEKHERAADEVAA